ncbi:hypothetical protein MTO96_003611 [Rhipicephalus appendiculatus]
MAFMSRATAYRRIRHAVQADVRAILVAAGEGIYAEENLSRAAFTSNQPEVPEPPLNSSLSQVEIAGFYGGVQPEVPESPLNRSLSQAASASIYGGVLESCDVEYHTGDSMHSVPVEPDNVPDGCHRCLTHQDTATDSNSIFMERIQVFNSIKHTQQVHSQYFNELLSNDDSGAPHPHGLPDLPFSNVGDALAYEEKLETQPSS